MFINIIFVKIKHISIIFNQERGNTTEPPPRVTFSGNVTQWEIYDAYQEDFEKQVQHQPPQCFYINFSS